MGGDEVTLQLRPTHSRNTQMILYLPQLGD